MRLNALQDCPVLPITWLADWKERRSKGRKRKEGRMKEGRTKEGRTKEGKKERKEDKGEGV
jgi:hypothetical protein